MARVAVLMAEGFEEGETTTIVDILRRAGVTCDSFGIGVNPVLGMHGMRVFADKVFPSDIARLRHGRAARRPPRRREPAHQRRRDRARP